MVISFCGHSDFYESDNIKIKLLKILEKEVGDSPADFYLGGYGGFDNYAKNVCKQFQKTHSLCKLYFITPYRSQKYLKNRLYLEEYYDGVILPDISESCTKFAILKRNDWMIEQADLIIAYVEHTWGGAAKSLEKANKLKKKIYNLAEQKNASK